MSDEERRQTRPQSMTRRYRRGLILVGVLCVLATLTAATLLFQRSYTERVDSYLRALCTTLAEGYTLRDTGNPEDLAALVADSGVRCTLIAQDGTVLYDSETNAPLPSHADRPEIQQAIKSGFGYSMRDSGSLDTRYVYAAVTLEGGGVLRLAVPMESVKHDIWNRSGILLQVGFITVIISFIIAVLVSLSLKNSFLPMIGIVKEIAQGQLHRRILQIPGREFAPLATAVNSMATSIEEQVHSYADKTAQLETVLNRLAARWWRSCLPHRYKSP